MELITSAQREQMLRNHTITQEKNNRGELHDPLPVVRLFTPDAGATWLLSEIGPDGDHAFGLCDLGVGFPELGFVLISEIRGVRGALGLPVERDVHFEADKPLSEYADAARKNRYIGH